MYDVQKINNIKAEEVIGIVFGQGENIDKLSISVEKGHKNEKEMDFIFGIKLFSREISLYHVTDLIRGRVDQVEYFKRFMRFLINEYAEKTILEYSWSNNENAQRPAELLFNFERGQAMFIESIEMLLKNTKLSNIISVANIKNDFFPSDYKGYEKRVIESLNNRSDF